MKYHNRKNPQADKEPEIDISFNEYNSTSEQLYEVTQDGFNLNPDIIGMYLKLYSNLNPELIINDAMEIDGVIFDTRIQKLPEFETNYKHFEMEQIKEADSRYIVSRFSLPGFKKLIDVVLSKVPIYGITVPLAEYKKFADLNSALDSKIFSFTYGDGLFFDENEKALYRDKLLLQSVTGKWMDGRDLPFVTESEYNFLIGMVNWPGTEDQEYNFSYRPYWNDFDLEQDIYNLENPNLLNRLANKLLTTSTHK